MKPDQEKRNRIRESHLGEVDARIALTRAVATWADSVNLRRFGNAVVWHAWDAVIDAHAEGGTPEQIAARIDEIVRSYGGTPKGGE